MLLENMADSPRFCSLGIEKSNRCPSLVRFPLNVIPATRSQLASPIRIQGGALQSPLVLCLAIFGTQLCLFRSVLFIVIDELSTLRRRPDNCTGPRFQLAAYLPLK